MNAISESTILRPAIERRNNSPRSLDGLLRLWRAGYELVLEACETLGGVFAMPLRRPPLNDALERLDDQLLNDIGYARRAGPGLQR